MMREIETWLSDSRVGNNSVSSLHCIIVSTGVMSGCLQCFDAVGWAAGRASSL